jgi:hypothetical protein
MDRSVHIPYEVCLSLLLGWVVVELVVLGFALAIRWG